MKNEITVDPMALTFELEVKAAGEKCANCGHKGLTVAGENAFTRFQSPEAECYVECKCRRCHALDRRTFTFINPKFAY